LNAISFAPPAGFLTSTGANVTLHMDTIINAAKSEASGIDLDILNEITSLRNAYTYRIGLEPVTVEETTRFGSFASSTFTAFPHTAFNGACSYTFNGAFRVTSTYDYPLASALSDSPSCVPSSGGGDPDPEPVDPIVDEELLEEI